MKAKSVNMFAIKIDMFIFSKFLSIYGVALQCPHDVRGFVAVGELTNGPPGTEAKFITKSRSLELLPGRITSAEYEAWICTADECFNV
jgi:hypothetical protein